MHALEFHCGRCQCLRIRLQRFKCYGIALDHHDALGSARSSLESERATPGEEIEAYAAGQILAEPVEQGLTHAVGRRPQIRAWSKCDQSAAPGAAYDSYSIPGHGRQNVAAGSALRGARTDLLVARRAQHRFICAD